jgi:hypothetical protein
MHGGEEQVPRGWRVLGSHFERETRMNIGWHDPELYYFLGLLTGIAALLAVIYELPRRKPGRAPPGKGRAKRP